LNVNDEKIAGSGSASGSKTISQRHGSSEYAKIDSISLLMDPRIQILIRIHTPKCLGSATTGTRCARPPARWCGLSSSARRACSTPWWSLIASRRPATPSGMIFLEIFYSVVDPGCVIPDPDFLSTLIPDPTSNNRGGGKICCINFFCSHKFYKIKNSFIFEHVPKQLSQLIYNYSTFYPKNSR
jgi:hypothetical protein